MDGIDGRVALITGSSRGIGAAIAEAFAAAGARVIIHGRDESALEAVRERVVRAAPTGHEPLVVRGDLTRAEDISKMRVGAEQRFGSVEILVANAGGSLTPPLPLEEIQEDQWRATVDANLTATFLTLKAFLPAMKQRKAGVIITMASSAARRPHPNAPIPYGAAKAGIQLLTQDLAMQVGPFGIRVNCIAPDTILTERNLARIPADARERMIESHPVRRLGTPADVAQAALYLASDAAGWISGITLDVAGGTVLR